MKKLVIIGIIIGILIILGAVGFYFLNSEPKEIFCPDYDGNEEECLSHPECEWDSQDNNCDPIGGMDEENIQDENDELNQELEDIEVPDTLPNQICKQIPLSGNPPYAERYYCLALINHDSRFCEGIDEEKQKNICLAHANKDSSYCEKLESEESKHVCYYMLAVSSKNADFCNKIDYSQHEKEQCYYSFMSNLYQWGMSDEIKTEYCDQLDSPDDDTCLALKEKDISICGTNPYCLTHFEQPVSFCETEDIDYVNCIKDRAKMSKNISICELLSQPYRDNCIGVYCTHIELDVNVCDNIEDIETRQDFYIELAMNLANGY